MESKFYVGQKVVSIRDHSQGEFKKGDVFKVIDINKSCCQYVIKIFDIFYLGMMKCRCGNTMSLGSIYFSQNSFAPIQEVSDMTFEDAIELVTTKKDVLC